MTSIGVGLLTFDHIRTGRQEDFERTLASIERANPDQLVVLTNGSTDGTEDRVRELGGIVDDTESQIWYGNTRLIAELSDNDLIVLSADDLEYDEGWLERVADFMAAAPPHLALASAYLEPIWPWNQPRKVITRGGQRAIVRDSVCGSSWIFRSRDWEWMGPFPEQMPGEDLVVCNRISARGFKMAALDLCEHIGIERSAWGNESHLTAEPFDRPRWGMPERVTYA